MEKIRLKTSPKDFFLHVLAIITLYASAVSFGTLIFQLINIWIPDPLKQDMYYPVDQFYRSLRYSISVVIIMFPAYIATMWYLQKQFQQAPEKRNARIRKWLIYFTLFAATVIILISLISLINHLLNGELTIHFFLKLVTIMVISWAIFLYYLTDIKKTKVEG